MNVVHVDTGTGWRGGQSQVLLLMHGLAARGVTSRLLAPRGPLLERARGAGFETIAWRALGDLDLVAAWRARHALAAVRPDIVHAHTARAHAVAVLAARMTGVPGVVVARRVDFRVGAHAFSRWKYRLPVDRYICISRPVLDVMRAAGIPQGRLALVPSGVPLEPPADAAGAVDLRALIGVPPDTVILGTVAALAPHKNHAEVLRAAPAILAALPDAHFVWIGNGECRAALEAARDAAGLADRVHVLGFREDARTLLRHFDLFVLASTQEGLCTSLLDAQAAGVPIVATRAGGIVDVVEDGVSGRLVAPMDAGALGRAIVDAIRRPDARARWVAGARERVARFSAERMVEGTLSVYRDVLRERGSG